MKILHYNEYMLNFSPRNKKARRLQIRFFAVFLFLILALIPVNSIFGDIFQWSVLGNILFFPADSGVSADPFHILPSLGAAASLQIWGPIRAEITEDIYIANYEYNPILGYPTASSQENRSALVFGFLTGIQITGSFNIREKGIVLRLFAGAAADIRAVVLAAGLNFPGDFTSSDIAANPQIQTDAIRDYFWSDGRWFMPVAGTGMDFPISEGLLLGFDLRVWFPVYKLNTDENLPAIDGWRFGLGFRITPRKKNGA